MKAPASNPIPGDKVLITAGSIYSGAAGIVADTHAARVYICLGNGWTVRTRATDLKILKPGSPKIRGIAAEAARLRRNLNTGEHIERIQMLDKLLFINCLLALLARHIGDKAA